MAKQITQSQLVQMLKDQRGCRPISIIACTTPGWRKRLKPADLGLEGEGYVQNPYADDVHKISYVNGMIGWSYARSVNAQRDREFLPADFLPVDRKWGQRAQREDGSTTSLVEHNGAYYVELKVERVVETLYVDADGNTVPDTDIKPWLRSRSASRQGVAKEVVLRDYRIDNIQQVRMGGELYEIVGE